MSGERFAAYYANVDVRTRLLNERRRRYSEDPVFRQAQLDRVARARQRNKKLDEPRTGRGPNKAQTIAINGKEIMIVGLGEAAKTLGVSKVAFRAYDDKGVIPRNRWIDKLGRRWYPAVFVEWLRPFFEAQSVRRSPLWEIGSRVERAWAMADLPKINEDSDAGDTSAAESS